MLLADWGGERSAVIAVIMAYPPIQRLMRNLFGVGHGAALVIIFLVAFGAWLMIFPSGVLADVLTEDPATDVKKPQTEKKDELSRTVAQVNGVPIFGWDLRMAMEDRIPLMGHRSLSPRRLNEIRREVLDSMITQEVLGQEAKRQNIKISDAEIEAEVSAVRARFGSKGDYQAVLKSKGMTPEDIRNGVERFLLINKLSDQEFRAKVRITDEEMLDYYNDHPEQFQRPQQIRLRILLIGVNPSAAPGDWEKARARAKEFADRARKGENLAGLVEQYSDEPNAEATAGDTGLLHQGMLPYFELESLAYDLEEGSISDPVETLYGFLVFRVEEKKSARQMAFENLNRDLLRSELKESSTERKLQKWVAGLREKAEIKLY